MAEIIKKQTWNGLLVESVTDTSTGVITIRRPYQNKPGEFLFEYAKSDPKVNGANWSYINQEVFRLDYNRSKRSQGFQETSQPEFNSLFYTQGFNKFNETRGDVLNDLNNYSSVDLSERSRSTFAQVYKIPYVKDPVTGQVVSSRGQLSSQPNTGQQLQPVTQEPDAQVPILSPEGVTDANKSLTSIKVGGSGLLKYPLLEPPAEFQYDYIMIQAFDYVASGLSNSTDPLKNLGPAREITILPMQPNISETNVVNWSDDQLNPVKAALGNFAVNTIGNLGNGKYTELLNTFKEGMTNFKDMITQEGIKSFAAAYFAGQAVGSNILGRSTGMVINPNLELLFNGPNLRTFNFSFRFTPRNKEEAEMIRLIIRAFKRNSAVIREPGFLFLRSPRVFKLQYIFKGSRIPAGGKDDSSDLHPYLNKIKPCALTSFSVNYTPDNSYMTFENGSLTCYQVDMTFSELMPIYEDELQGFEPNMGY